MMKEQFGEEWVQLTYDTADKDTFVAVITRNHELHWNMRFLMQFFMIPWRNFEF